MGAAIRIAMKDLRQRLRDRSALMLGIVAPLGLAFIFSLIIPEMDDFSVRLGVVDADRGELSTVLIDDVFGALTGEDELLTIVTLSSRSDAAAAVEAGEVDAAVIIPTGFTAAVEAADPGTCNAGECTAARIEVIGHVDRQTSAQIAEAITTSFAGRLTGVRVALATAFATGARNTASVAAAASQTPPHITLDQELAATRELDISTFFAAGMAVFFVFFTVQFGVASLLEERTLGTMPRLLAAPIKRGQIVAGKALAAFLLGVVAMTVLAVGSTLFIGAEWGNPLGVALLIVTAVLAAIGIMAVIATLAKTPEQAGNWQAIVAVVLGMLGGTFFPISQAPGLLSRLTFLTPHAWFMRGLGDLAGGGGAGEAVEAALAMLVFAVVTVALAATRLRRMVAA